MKYFALCFIIVLGTGSSIPVHAFQEKEKSAEIDLEKIDAAEAMAVANAWKLSRKDVKTSVTAHEVIFKFSDGNVKKIPLPEDKMLVAVAPYIRHTHK
jgi:hypothetical protein